MYDDDYENYNFEKTDKNKTRRLQITLKAIVIILIIGLIGTIGFGIFKWISLYNKSGKENVKIAINEINTAPNLKKIELNDKYNNDIYASIVMKGISQVKGVTKNEISNLNFSGFFGFEKINNEFSSEAALTSELDNALTMKMIRNFEDYINDGNLKLNLPAIEKELGVKNEKDIFVSAKIVKNKEPNLPNRNLYIDPKIAMFKGIKIPEYKGGYLEIVFFNKNNVINYLNKANQNQGSEKYKVSDENINGFNIVLAYIWMNNKYTPLYYTDTPLYSGATGWTIIDRYNNDNSNNENNSIEERPVIYNKRNIDSKIEEEAEGISSDSNNPNIKSKNSIGSSVDTDTDHVVSDTDVVCDAGD